MTLTMTSTMTSVPLPIAFSTSKVLESHSTITFNYITFDSTDSPENSDHIHITYIDFNTDTCTEEIVNRKVYEKRCHEESIQRKGTQLVNIKSLHLHNATVPRHISETAPINLTIHAMNSAASDDAYTTNIH